MFRKSRTTRIILGLIITGIIITSNLTFTIWYFQQHISPEKVPRNYKNYQIVYRIKGTFKNFDALESYPQTILRKDTKKKFGEVDIGINITNSRIKRLPLGIYEYPIDILKYTSPSAKIQSNHENITTLANILRGNTTDILMIAQNVANWTSTYIRYDENLAQKITWGLSDTQDALTTLQQMKGTCSEYTYIFLAVMRNLGIPARYVRGKMYDYSLHAWAEIYLFNVGWIPIDPQAYTLNYVYIGTDYQLSRYIKLYAGLDFVDIGIKLKDLDFTYTLLYNSFEKI
jgi:transglutaminase-like putative cysteine protease